MTLITPQAQVTPAGILPRMRRFTVVGVFSVGMYEYDRATAFIHLDDGARLMKLKDEVSSVRLKLEDMFQAPELSYELNQSMGDRYWITDWTKQHANFFRAVKTEKRVMFFILLLIVAVAAFNIVSTLVMLVNDKRSDIAILRTLGLTPGQVMGVFMVQGILIGMIGTTRGFYLESLWRRMLKPLYLRSNPYLIRSFLLRMCTTLVIYHQTYAARMS